MYLTLDNYENLEQLPKPGSRKDPLRHLRSRVPEGRSGRWVVERFEVELDIQLLRMIRDGRGTVPGFYIRLSRDGKVIMSDTDAELADLQRLFTACRRFPGRVLIHGLGLGIALQGVLAVEGVEHVDVVELSSDVLSLVAPYFTDPRVEFHCDDCLGHRWPGGTRWDVVWHDIWNSICPENLPEMNRLTRKFANRCRWQHCWAREWIR